MDCETLPFQVNLGYRVPRRKAADYVDKKALEDARAKIEEVIRLPPTPWSG